jgi:hypothetical protein
VIQYELLIKCKACYDERHSNCSSKRPTNEDYTPVKISCTCVVCADIASRNGGTNSNFVNAEKEMALEQVEGPIANALKQSQSLREKAENDYR